MKKCVFGSIVFMLILAACHNNQDQHADKTVTGEASLIIDKSDSAATDENLAIINETGFSKYAKASIPQLNWNKFVITKFWQEDFQNKSAFTPDKSYFDSYGRFLKYAPDSTKFIDLDSYNIAISKNKKGQLIGNSQDPDTEVSLIDLKNKEKIRLVFLGPGNSVEDAAWINNDNLILIGYLENDAATATNAAIWQINLSSKKVNLYELSDDSLLKKLKNYSIKERLKDVLIDH